MAENALLRRPEPLSVDGQARWSLPRAPSGLARVLGLCCPLLLAACAIPLPVQVAGWVADGFSYLTTEKSVSDHGISAVVGQDCALYRGVTEGTVCREEQTLDVAVAAGPADAGAPGDIANGDPDDDPPPESRELSLVAPDAGPAEGAWATVHDPLLPGECRSAGGSRGSAGPGSGIDNPWAVLNCVAPTT